MSGHGILEVTLISAKDLKNVNYFTKLRVYAVASLSSDPSARQRTLADNDNRRNPTWNATFRFSLPPSAHSSALTLDILLRAKRAIRDRVVGEIHVPIADLAAGVKGRQSVSYQVRRPSGRAKGVLSFSYRFEEAAATVSSGASYPPEKKAEEPVTAYPAFPQPYAQPVNYPPPAWIPGYSQAPAGYPGYSQAPAGYGAVPAAKPQQQAGRRNKFGMGLGAGLLGGALGGLLIGDMVSDAAGSFDGGFDF